MHGNKVILAGGSGFVGQAVVQALRQQGLEPVVISRGPNGIPWSRLPEVLPGAQGIVNLAGENLAAGRWSPARKAEILASRIQSTERIVAALQAAPAPVPPLIQASAVGFYGSRGPERVSEETPPGNGFLADVCRQWESLAKCAPGRVVCLRLGVVLARHGGAFPKMAGPVRWGVGAGFGPQGLSWIHLQDVVRMILEALFNPRWEGAINATAPEPLSHDKFMEHLGKHLHRPVWPVPHALVATGLRALLGEMSCMVLEGSWVIPARAQQLGFHFSHPTLDSALAELLGEG